MAGSPSGKERLDLYLDLLLKQGRTRSPKFKSGAGKANLLALYSSAPSTFKKAADSIYPGWDEMLE